MNAKLVEVSNKHFPRWDLLTEEKKKKNQRTIKALVWSKNSKRHNIYKYLLKLFVEEEFESSLYPEFLKSMVSPPNGALSEGSCVEIQLKIVEHWF